MDYCDDLYGVLGLFLEAWAVAGVIVVARYIEMQKIVLGLVLPHWLIWVGLLKVSFPESGHSVCHIEIGS